MPSPMKRKMYLGVLAEVSAVAGAAVSAAGVAAVDSLAGAEVVLPQAARLADMAAAPSSARARLLRFCITVILSLLSFLIRPGPPGSTAAPGRLPWSLYAAPLPARNHTPVKSP